jgi:hypothetical protein
MSYGRWDASFFERGLEFLYHDLTRRLEAVAHDTFPGIVGDEVHMSELSF